MALATQTLLSLIQKLGEATSDFLEFDTTTNITTNNYVISTTLGQYDESEDDHFGGAGTEWWIYIDSDCSVLNSDVLRRCTDYSAASTRITVAGAALLAESAAVTCRLYRYNRSHMVNALAEACNEIHPALYTPLEDQTLITGNILPDASFEDWSSSSALNWYTVLSGTLAQTSTAGSVGQGAYSAKYTAGAASDYFYISSNTYPRLLDLGGQNVSIYCSVISEVANDSSMTIYTLDSAGSTQTLPTTTACAAGKKTILSLEGQPLNDDLVEIQIRFGVTTNTKYAIFDDALVTGRTMYEYVLPPNFRDGHLSNVFMQTEGGYASSTSHPSCYAFNPFATINSGVELPFNIVNDGSQRYLKVMRALSSGRRLRLIGNTPLKFATNADSDTITLDSWRVPLLIARARMIFWEREAVPISSQDKARFEYEYAKAERDYRRALTRMRMVSPPVMI